MQHLTDGQLRAYQDQALGTTEHAQVHAHLLGCPVCQQHAHTLAARAEAVAQRLAILAPPITEAAPSLWTARTRLEQRQIKTEQEQRVMWKKAFYEYRAAWSGLAAVLVLGIALTIPSVRAVAGNFLGLFRVQEITIVQVDPSNLSSVMGASSQIGQLISDEVQVEPNGEWQAVKTAAEASAVAGIPVRLPSGLGEVQELSVQPGANLTFKVDLPRVRALLDEIGRSDITLPDNLDGATVAAELPRSVTANYGDCGPKGRDEESDAIVRERTQEQEGMEEDVLYDCTILAQLASPAVSAPAELDMAQLGQAYLQITGMSAEKAAELSKTIDWSTTLVLPIPRYNTEFQSVQVDGVTGTLIHRSGDPDASTHYMLLWVKNDIVYALSGPGSNADAIAIANSLQ